MRPCTANTHIASAIGRPFDDDAAAWLDEWTDARYRKLAHDNGPPAMALLVPMISEWIAEHIPAGQGVTVKTMEKLEQAMRPAEEGNETWLCEP
ncbi:MAG: hypothetical protein O7A04_02115 [Acidobacteria bacterium]|nr:hypothetical protein [Acidobacteriota bacterium]